MKLCKSLAMLCALLALILELVSSLSYPKAGQGTGTTAANKMMTVQKLHNWALILGVLSVYFAVMCLIKY